MTQKETLRAEWKKNYPKDEASRINSTKRIVELIKGSDVFQKANAIGLYAALPWEPDLKSLWFSRPSQCVFPRVDRSTGMMQFYRISDWKDLVAGYAGILEPQVPEGYRHQTWGGISLVLVPGFAFDAYGARVGSGKGFYDKFFADPALKSVQKWGVCLKEQFHQGRLEQEPTDVRMDAIVTNEGFFPVEQKA